MIYLVDIENIPSRYSEQWRNWHCSLLEMNNIPYEIIGFNETIKTKPNEFMSFIPSNNYKSRQIQTLASLLSEEKIKAEDIVFFMDAWHPGVVSLYQMRIFYPFKFKIYGFWHAGSYDPFDILGSHKDSLLNVERGFSECYDKNLFATNFSKTLFEKSIGRSPKNKKIGFLFDIDQFKDYRKKKENIIVFPHRIAPEKHPELFDALQEEIDQILPGKWRFVKTIEATNNKEEYYELLSRAKISVSFADQETFGISMIESFMCGCYTLVPNRLSYKEIFSEPLRYNSFMELKNKIVNFSDSYEADKDTSERINNITNGNGLVSLLMF